jgi:hypothetical protein
MKKSNKTLNTSWYGLRFQLNIWLDYIFWRASESRIIFWCDWKLVFRRINDARHSAWDLFPTEWSSGTLCLINQGIVGSNPFRRDRKRFNNFEWTPRSSDLTAPHNSLWSLVKNGVLKQRYGTVGQLRHR